MPFYTGKSADGSDIREVQGMYVSPDGKEWGSKPYTEEQRADERYYKTREEVYDHINAKRTLREEYHLILAKQSKLCRRCRDWVVKCFDNHDYEDG